MEDVKMDILGLQYQKALEKLWLAANSQASPWNDVASELLEVAYFYNESGSSEEAADIAERIITLSKRAKLIKLVQSARTDKPQARKYIRQALQKLNKDHFSRLEKRYFPEMVPVPGGTFMLGFTDEETSHLVRLDDFRIAQTETTNWQYALFCKATGRDIRTHSPSWGLFGDNPVVNVHWYDAVEYANWLSAHLGLEQAYTIDRDQKDPYNQNKYDQIKWTVKVNWQAKGFCLPTEAEWEYAARGGQQSKGFRFAGSDNLEEVGWFLSNTNRTQKVAEKKPNELNLYDMSGNVWEWCWDWYEDVSAGPAENPRGPQEGTYRVIRGGSWYVSDDLCLVSNRNYGNPYVRHDNYGLRLTRGS